jgi:hypothetical protein
MRARPEEPCLGGDLQPLGVRVEGLGEDQLTDVRPVGVGGVDEVDAKLDRPADHPDGLVPVPGLAPDARTGDPHRAEAEAIHRTEIGDVDLPAA